MYVFMVKAGDWTVVVADDLSSAWTSIVVATGFNVDELHVSQYVPRLILRALKLIIM
jgi:hypothetical protein